jgi:hypothetical protein
MMERQGQALHSESSDCYRETRGVLPKAVSLELHTLILYRNDIIQWLLR